MPQTWPGDSALNPSVASHSLSAFHGAFNRRSSPSPGPQGAKHPEQEAFGGTFCLASLNRKGAQ
eukprot:10009516-Alexandrium_andersonii.AAC.1